MIQTTCDLGGFLVTFHRLQWRIQDFPEGGAPTPKSAIIFQFFAENCMKMKEFGPPRRGARPWRPLGSANGLLSESASLPVYHYLRKFSSRKPVTIFAWVCLKVSQSYHESISLSILKSYNVVNWPGLSLMLVHHWLMLNFKMCKII